MSRLEILTYINALGESVEFSHRSTYCPQNVSGLADISSTLYTISSMGQDGDTLVGTRIESRDIDISGFFRTRSHDGAREARQKLARVLNPQLSATLLYQYGSFKRLIPCRAVNAPEITKPAGSIYTAFSVQLACLNPFWRDEAESRDDIAAWIGGLEFPVELTTAGNIVGYRQPSLIVNVFNGGDVSTGIRVEFRALGDVERPLLSHVDTQEFIRLNMLLHNGDVLTMSTGYGDKWARLNRGGLQTDALHFVDVDSTFLKLFPGDNLIRYDADEGLSNLEVSIYHTNLYLGV